MADSPESSNGGPKAAALAADLGPALKQEAAKLADKSVSSGLEAAQAVGKAAESAAQALDELLPMLAGYVRNVAQYTGRLADDLRDKKAEELLSTALTWSRQQPLVMLGGAAVLGFALSRIAKAGLSEAAASGSTADGASTDGPTGASSTVGSAPGGGYHAG